jgi:hypothetical protein
VWVGFRRTDSSNRGILREMTSQKPPPRRSKAPPPLPPKRRETVEVELDWLEPEDKPKAKKAKQPPPIPGVRVHAPPMPVKPSKPPPPARAQTMEVDMREVVIVPHVPVKELLKPRPAHKPIPREDEDASPRKASRPPPAHRR